MIRQLAKSLIVAAASLCLCATTMARSGAEEFLIRYAGIQGEKDAATKAQFHFKEEVERESKGRIKVQVFYGTQLAGGNTIDQLRFAKLGAIEMNAAGLAQLSQDVPDFGAPTLPFLFTSTSDAASKVNGKAAEILNAGAEKVGLKVLGFHFLGLRNLLTANKPVRSLDDIKGLKLRVVQGAVPLATYKALGANPVAMDFAEVPAGMTQGVVDGMDFPYTSVVSVKAYSYGKYYTILKTYLEAQAIVINLKFFNKLPPDLQQIVVTAMKNKSAFELEQNIKDEALAKEELVRNGVEIFDLAPADTDRAHELLKGVYSDYEKKFPPALIAALQGKS